MNKKTIPEMIPVRCCGLEPNYNAVFKARYKGLAYEFKCKQCGHFAASPNRDAAIRAWNINVTGRRGRLH